MNSYTIKYGDTLSSIASKVGKSVNDLLRLNPSIANPDKIIAGKNLSIGDSSAVPTPKPSTVTQPQRQQNSDPQGSILAAMKPFNYDNGINYSDPKEIEAKQALVARDKNVDPNTKVLYEDVNAQIRAAQRAAMQSRVDAMNAATEQMIAQFRNTTGRAREGQSYALAAAGGRIGSATGEGEIRRTEDLNDQQANEMRTQNQLQVQALYGMADQAAIDESNRRLAAFSKAAEDAVNYLNTAPKQKAAAGLEKVRQLLASGYTADQILKGYDDNSKFRSDLITAYGFDKGALAQALNTIKSEKDQIDLETKKAQADLAKSSQFDLSEGQARYTIDPVTGEAKLIASKAKTYAPTGGNGTTPDPVVDSWVSQINAGKATIANVPANLKNSVIQALTSSTPTTEDSSYQINTLKSALENVNKLKGAAGPSAIGRTLGDAFIGNSSFRQLEAYVDTVKSNLLTLVTDPNIKKFFGPQMSNRDVELMTSTASSLDAQRLGPEQIQAEVDKINAFLQKYEAARNSSAVASPSASTITNEQSALRSKYQY